MTRVHRLQPARFEGFLEKSGSLHLDTLRAWLENPFGGAAPDAKSLSHAYQEAAILAEAAYGERNKAAEAHAERVLYLIHTLNHFAPPLQAIPSVIWSALARAKLHDALFVQQEAPPLSETAWKEILPTFAQEADLRDHPLLDEICAAAEPRALAIYAKNWMVTAHGFVNQLASLFQRAPGHLRTVVRENMGDEFKGIEHAVLRDRFLKSVGVDYSPRHALEDPDYLPESMSVLNYRTALTSLANPYFAFGSFYSIEGVFYLVSRRLACGLRARGFDEAAFEMFTVHSEVDHDHAREWVESLEAADLNDQERGWVVAGARAQMRLRHEHYEALRASVKPFLST